MTDVPFYYLPNLATIYLFLVDDMSFIILPTKTDLGQRLHGDTTLWHSCLFEGGGSRTVQMHMGQNLDSKVG
jgi:hypothetical protein